MPSLFSRSRTTSTPSKKHSLSPISNPSATLDEFGRVSSKLSAISINTQSSPSKKDKKKAKEQEKLLKAQGFTRDRPELEDPPTLSDGAFFPLNLERPRSNSGTDEQLQQHDYGYLSYERHVVLGVEQAARLVIVISDELATRGGIATPFIFSTTALDISSTAIKRLIRTFLNTCMNLPGHAAAEAETKWRDEARFAGPHELGMCLRWGLARVVRFVGGHDERGLISWDHYTEFRDSEAALRYPPTHFSTFLPKLDHPVQSIIISVLTLLSRLTANGTMSGHTPPTLSPLFGPLLFGLGPATLAFHPTYFHYLRAVNAMEHILLAFIRWQDSPRPFANPNETPTSGSVAALGVPIRLKEWIKGYPAMLSFLHGPKNQNQKPQPRRGVRTVRVLSVRRNVRMYSPDLVKTAASWAQPGAATTVKSSSALGGNGLATSKEWSRIVPPSLKLTPRYSEAFRKRMNLSAGFHPDLGPGATLAPPMGTVPSASSYSSSMSIGTSIDEQGETEGRFRSLTDMKWGEFESVGFGGLGETQLQFDLTESARTERSVKRESLSWNDFSSAGFSRTNAPLSTTLQFSSPVAKAISTWPAHNAEMSKKLKKTEKSLPPFGWDTEPVVGNEEMIEEAFVDVFCDLVYGGGWMDLERGEGIDRDCNWALVEFKSLPQSQTTASGTTDPRLSTVLILFEEFVPLEYRQQLTVLPSTRRRLPSLFSQSSKPKAWKQAATLNGRPYVVGHVPRSPSYRELEFEGLLHGGAATKVISLGPKPTLKNHPSPRFSAIPPPLPSTLTSLKTGGISNPLYLPASDTVAGTLEVPALPPGPKSDEVHTDSTRSPSMISTKRSSRFRLPVPMTSPGGRRIPAEYSTVDFETRLASYSDDERNNGDVAESEAVKQKRRESKDDAWVDILVGTHARRMGGQDAELKEGGGGRRRGIRSRRSDPDIASLEVAQVLAGVRERTPPSPTSVVNRRQERVDMDPAGGLERFYNDQDVDEIETVPRTSEARSEDDTTDRSHYNRGEDADDEDEHPSVAAQLLAGRQQRMGYFDLHPERKAAVTDLNPPSEDDPRERLAHDFDSDRSDDEDVIAEPTVGATLRKLPIPPEPTRPPPDAPSHGTIAALRVQLEPKVNVTSISTNGNDAQSQAIQSKTAALIEMYRERERSTPPKPSSSGGLSPGPPMIHVSPLQPSRLPLRSTSQGAGIPKVEITPSPSMLSHQEIMPPPEKLGGEVTGRASPARYEHGTPLHNVMEEEEEEE